MTTRFLIIAALMVVVALACVLVPMLRSARRADTRPRAPFWLAIALVLVTPPVVLGLYLAIGTPQALQAAPVDTHAQLVEATQQLQTNLAKKPDDAQGWALLAQAYSALNQPKQALDALNHLLKLKPDDPDALVAWVEARAETSPSRLIDDASRTRLEHALKVDPTHQRALWLLGISDFQRQQYADAVKQWRTLLPLLQPGSKVATTVKQELVEAEQAAGMPVAPAPATSAAASDSSVALAVTVKLDPKLAGKVKPGDTLFVFARAVNGPPMPLAVAKLKATDLPTKVTLTDAMAMTPSLRLSKFEEVSVAARISASGDALPAAGDLESAPVKVATSSHAPIALTIDKVD